MLARTRTTRLLLRLGKEIGVFVTFRREQMRLLFNIHSLQFGGATGNYNAHHVAYPQIDWRKFGTFVEENQVVHHSFFRPQIEHYDHFAAFLML
jgi:adenylosuccinate lyase